MHPFIRKQSKPGPAEVSAAPSVHSASLDTRQQKETEWIWRERERITSTSCVVIVGRKFTQKYHSSGLLIQYIHTAMVLSEPCAQLQERGGISGVLAGLQALAGSRTHCRRKHSPWRGVLAMWVVQCTLKALGGSPQMQHLWVNPLPPHCSDFPNVN